MSTPEFFDIQSKDLETLATKFDGLIADMPDILDQFASERADIIVQIGQRLAHKLSGEMARTWHKEKVGNGHYIVKSDVDYAIYEINRPGTKPGEGPHDFVTETLREYASLHEQRLINKYVDIIIQRIVI